jgi:dTMP kinase
MLGRFITLEGIEGVGKSTQLTFIKNYLTQHKQSIVVTREPGGTPVAEAVRHLVLKQHEEQITPEAELLMLFAGRAQHIAHVVRPALLAGKWVICDRFTDATYAYQGAGRKMSLTQIATLEKWVQKKLQPDCTLLLDAPVKIAMKRIKRRGKADRIEAEQAAFFERVRAAYLARAKQFPKRYKVINAAAPLLKVQKQIKLILDDFLC